MANFLKNKYMSGATTSNQSQSSFSQSQSTQTQNGKSWTESSISKETQKALKKAEKPFSSIYTNLLKGTVNSINNRKPFEYDLNEDALYKQYAEQYKNLGNQAMQDTMANAATLTGGYGSSYATTAGQQAFNSYMEQLNDIVPNLYAQARSNYDSDTSRLYDQANLYAGLESNEWSKWSDNRNYISNKANNERNQNAVSYSTQTNTTTQTDRSSSNSSSTQNTYVNPKYAGGSGSGGSGSTSNSLVLPTYEERVDAAHSYNKAKSLMDFLGLSGSVSTFKEWKQNNKGSYTDYQNYLSNTLSGIIDTAYTQKDRKKAKNKK